MVTKVTFLDQVSACVDNVQVEDHKTRMKAERERGRDREGVVSRCSTLYVDATSLTPQENNHV